MIKKQLCIKFVLFGHNIDIVNCDQLKSVPEWKYVILIKTLAYFSLPSVNYLVSGKQKLHFLT